MFQNLLKIAFRNFNKDWKYTAFNVICLALAISTSIFMFKYAHLESDIDNFHEKGKRIYKVYSDMKFDENEQKFGSSAPAIATSIQEHLEEVEIVTRVYPYYKTYVKIKNELFIEENILAVDSNFLDVFSYDLIHGNKELLFTDPKHVVLTEEYSNKYFKNGNAIGKSIEINGEMREVTGIIDGSHSDSHLNFDVLTSISADKNVENFEWSWIWSNLSNYVVLREGVTTEKIDTQMNGLVEQYAEYAIKRITGSGFKKFVANGNRLAYYLVPLKDLYYDTNNTVGPSTNKMYITTFRIISLIILFLACINYALMSSAQAMKRQLETGIRKALGSGNGVIIIQYLLEVGLEPNLIMLLIKALKGRHNLYTMPNPTAP